MFASNVFTAPGYLVKISYLDGLRFHYLFYLQCPPQQIETTKITSILYLKIIINKASKGVVELCIAADKPILFTLFIRSLFVAHSYINE